MVKKALVLLIGVAITGTMAARTLYRIELRGAAPVVARDAPAPHGTILVFHRHPDGRLTGVPREDVVSVTPVASGRRGEATARKVRVTTTTTTTASPAVGEPMQPGDTLVLGPTGGDGSIREAGAAAAQGAQGAAQVPPGTVGTGYTGPVGPNGLPVGAGGGPGNVNGNVNPNLALQPPAATTVGADGVPRASSGPPPTVDPATGQPPTNPPVQGSTANPAGSTPAGTTVAPAGSTQPGTTVQPVQPGAAGQPQTPPQQTGTTSRRSGSTSSSGSRRN